MKYDEIDCKARDIIRDSMYLDDEGTVWIMSAMFGLMDYNGRQLLKLKRHDRTIEDYDFLLIADAPNWETLEINTPMLVRNFGDTKYTRRYYAGLDRYGCPSVFRDGCTSWTAESDKATVHYAIMRVTEMI